MISMCEHQKSITQTRFRFVNTKRLLRHILSMCDHKKSIISYDFDVWTPKVDNGTRVRCVNTNSLLRHILSMRGHNQISIGFRYSWMSNKHRQREKGLVVSALTHKSTRCVYVAYVEKSKRVSPLPTLTFTFIGCIHNGFHKSYRGKRSSKQKKSSLIINSVKHFI